MKKTIVDFANKTSQEVEMSAEEEAQTLIEIEQSHARKAIHDTANQQKEVDAKKGNDKLVALGLTQKEVTAMTNYKPPAEEEE